MKKTRLYFATLTLVLTGCNNHNSELTGKACLGQNNDTLIEALENKCRAGDTIVTKHPAYFCDFTYTVTFNQYNSAFCVFSGHQAEDRISQSSTDR